MCFSSALSSQPRACRCCKSTLARMLELHVLALLLWAPQLAVKAWLLNVSSSHTSLPARLYVEETTLRGICAVQGLPR